jgi:hypothetical protein
VWWAGSKVHDVYLGTRAVAVCEGAQVLVAEPADNFDAALAAFSAWLASAQGRLRVRVWLSGGLCRPFIVPDVQGVKAHAERLKVASALAAQQTGLVGECQVWLEQRKTPEASIAVAVQKDRLSQILDVMAPTSRRAKLLSIRPWWSEALRHAVRTHPQVAVLGVQDCDSMTVLVGQGVRYEAASTYSPVTDAPTAQSVLTRALMARDGAEEGEPTIARLVWQRPAQQDAMPDVALGAMAEFSR